MIFHQSLLSLSNPIFTINRAKNLTPSRIKSHLAVLLSLAESYYTKEFKQNNYEFFFHLHCLLGQRSKYFGPECRSPNVIFLLLLKPDPTHSNFPVPMNPQYRPRIKELFVSLQQWFPSRESPSGKDCFPLKGRGEHFQHFQVHVNDD